MRGTAWGPHSREASSSPVPLVTIGSVRVARVSSAPTIDTRSLVLPAVIKSPSLRSAVATFRPLTLVPLVLSMSVRRQLGGFTSIMKWMREILLSFTASRKLARSDRPTIKLARSLNSKTVPSWEPAFTGEVERA